MQTKKEGDVAAEVTQVIEADQMKEEKSIVLKAVETKTTIQKDHQETLIPTVIDVDPDLKNK